MGGYVPYITILQSLGPVDLMGLDWGYPHGQLKHEHNIGLKGYPGNQASPHGQEPENLLLFVPFVSGKTHILFFTKDHIVLMKPRCLSDPYALAQKKATHQVSSGSHSCRGSWSRPPVCAAATATLQRRRSAFFSWPKFWWTKAWSTSSGHSSIIQIFLGFPLVTIHKGGIPFSTNV